MKKNICVLLLCPLLLSGCSDRLMNSDESDRNEIISLPENIIEIKDDKEYETKYSPYIITEEANSKENNEEIISEEMSVSTSNISSGNMNILKDNTAIKDKSLLIPEDADIHFVLQKKTNELGGFANNTDDFYINTKSGTFYYIEGYEALKNEDKDVNRYRRFENILADEEYTYVMTKYLETFAAAKKSADFNIDAEFAPFVSDDGTLYFYDDELYREFKQLAGF